MSTLVVTAAERLTALEKCPFEANSMGAALASLQVWATIGLYMQIAYQCAGVWRHLSLGA